MTVTAILTVLSLLGSGLMAGLFFAFSVSVMPALGRRPAKEGMAAMQQINTAIVNPVFLAAFFGPALTSVALAVMTVIDWGMTGGSWLLAGGLVHLIGTILVTVARNVPMNNALAAADPETEEGIALWARYLTRWTAWNHLRVTLNLSAMLLLAVGMLQLGISQ